MNVLGWFHYLLMILILLITIPTIIVGPEQFGLMVKEKNNPVLSFLNQYSDEVAGLTAIILLFISVITEFYLGWSCRRKARRPEKLLLTLALSGAKTLFSLFTVLRGGLLSVNWLDTVYSLFLNLITFLLAFWIRREYNRNRKMGHTES